MGNLTGFALRNQTTVMVLVLLVAVYGFAAYSSLPKQQDPGFTIRAAVVTTRFPGAGPEKVEQLVTDRIEKAIQEIPELDNVISESQPGLSFVTANFLERYTDMRPIFDKLRRKIEDIRSELPEGVREPVVNDAYGDVFGSVYALTGEGFSYAELKEIADQIKDRLLKIDQIAKVEIQGTQDEVVFVEYNIARLTELGLSPQQLSDTLSSVNIVRGGGDIRAGRERVRLEPTGNFEDLEDIRRTVIRLPGSGIVYLADIAEIYRDYKDPPSSFARSNGAPALILSVSLRQGGNILELGQILKRETPDIEADYPLGVRLTPIFLQSGFVDRSVNSFAKNLLQAVAIVVIVMLVFLGLRTGLIVATLVPASVFMSLSLMQAFGITVNQISLAALIIALGLLVDNAIVMAESIMVRRQQGAAASDAACAAGREMAVPLLTSSLTTAAAFLPIFLAESAVGEYTADIFRVVSIALLSSWVLAMTFIPMMTVLFMKVDTSQRGTGGAGRLLRAYDGLLRITLRNRLLFLVLIAGVFYSALWALQFVPSVFIPPRTDPVITGKFNMPRGTAIETTQAIAADIENFMADRYWLDPGAAQPGRRGIVSWATWIGQSAPRYTLALDPGSADPSAFSMLINTTDYRIIPEIASAVQDYAREAYPDLEVQLKKLENGQPIPYPIAIRVSGPDMQALYELVAPIKDRLWSMPGILAVNDDWGPRSKKLLVRVDQERALRAGVSSEDVAVSLEAGLSGIELTEFREDDETIPVTLRSVAADRQDIGKLEGMTVYSPSADQTVPLRQVADVAIAWQPGVIKRRDRDRTITVQAQLLPGVTATDINRSLLPWLDEQARNWPRRYAYEVGGESETSGDANQAIAAKLPIAGMLILLLLVAQFNSVRKPLIILTTIPLGLIGVVYGLLIAASVFGFFTILGIISLSGIVINNAIVLIDRVDIEIEENGRSPWAALFAACRQRLRPILLTTATTAGGMLPLWLSRDPMFETMAVTIIFGLLFATLLTLLVVPVLYSLLFRVQPDAA